MEGTTGGQGHAAILEEVEEVPVKEQCQAGVEEEGEARDDELLQFLSVVLEEKIEEVVHLSKC